MATQDPSPEFLDGAAMILATVVRMGGAEMARSICDAYELALGDFEGVVFEGDLAELRDVLGAPKTS